MNYYRLVRTGVITSVGGCAYPSSTRYGGYNIGEPYTAYSLFTNKREAIKQAKLFYTSRRYSLSGLSYPGQVFTLKPSHVKVEAFPYCSWDDSSTDDLLWGKGKGEVLYEI
jgi:hypothetical protein